MRSVLVGSSVRRAPLLACALIVHIACDRAPTPPTSPTSAGAVLESLVVTGVPPDFSVGETAQLEAEARWSTGQKENVTASVVWTSRSPVCTLTATGLLRAVETGECSVDASFGGVSATLNARIGAPRIHTISGVVRERYAPGFVPVTGATVAVISGTLAGRSAVTNASGQYTFDKMRLEAVTLSVEADGFERATAEATPGSPTRDIQLAPRTAVLDWDSRAQPARTDVRIPFRVTHWGPATLTMSSDTFYCGTYGDFSAIVRAAGSGEHQTSTFVCRPGTAKVQVPALRPGEYELEIRLFPFSTGANLVRLEHPR